MLRPREYVREASSRALATIDDWLTSILERSDAFIEPYFVTTKTYLLPKCPGAWVLAQFNTPRLVNFAFRPHEAFSRSVIHEPVIGEYVDEPLLGFKVPAYFVVSIQKAALVTPEHSELLLKEIKGLVNISLQQMGGPYSDLYDAGFTDSVELLRRGQAFGDRSILFACALNSNCPTDVLSRLVQCNDPLILKAVATNPKLLPEQQLGLLSNPHLDYRGFCAIASRLQLETIVRERLQQCGIPAVNSYLSGPRMVEHFGKDCFSEHLPAVLDFFEHLLGRKYLENVTRRNTHYFDYFSRHQHLYLEELIYALESQGIRTKRGQQIFSGLFSAAIDRGALTNVFTRLANSVENVKRFRELDIKPFSYIVQYEHIWSLRWQTADSNFNIALEYAPELYYPERISIPEINKGFAQQRFHLWNSICWCCGRIVTHEGKTALFILELQSDLFRLSQAPVSKYFKDWPRLLLNIVIAEAKRRGVEAIYLLPSKALCALYGRLYGMKYVPKQTAAWSRIYDETAGRLGMNVVNIAPVDIFNVNWVRWNPFKWDEFYYADTEDLMSRELIDSCGRNVRDLV